jgi:hypothetical protein
MGLTRSRFPQRWRSSPEDSDQYASDIEDDEEYGAVWSDVPWPLLGDGQPAPDILPLEPLVATARTRRQATRSRVSG